MKYLFTLTMALLISADIFVACGNNAKDGWEATVTELSSEEFNDKVYDLNAETPAYLGKLPAIVDFNAKWCGPCRKIAPVLEELAAEYAGQIVIYKVDVDRCGDVAAAFGIKSIPAVLYIPLDGEPQMTIGSRSKAQFEQEIRKILLGE